MPRILFTEQYEKRAKRFAKRHPDMLRQYEKTLLLLEANPHHPSLRLHTLKGKLSDVYSVSINLSYRISMEFLIETDMIIPIDIGTHDEVY